MEELTCWDCGEHVGWMSDAGPHGFVQCDGCYEESNEEGDDDE